jgi:hypothetical protein
MSIQRVTKAKGVGSKPASILALIALFLGGCGGATKTVSVANAPTPTTTPTTSSTTTTASNTSTTSATRTGTATATTRTASAPAFVPHPTPASQTASAAASVLRAHGYTPNDISQYHPNQTLQVLVGTHTGSGDGYGQQAFFFVGGRYIGTDASQPSATLRVIGQSDTQITLAYPLYRSHDALCCPSGGEAKVSFQLNNGQLAPMQPIPPVSSPTGLSRG